MSVAVFPSRLETDRLVFERLGPGTTDVFELYAFMQRDDWQGAATEHMPWFRLERIDQVADLVDHAHTEWTDRETARYLLRAPAEDDAIVGTTAFDPEWETRRAGADIVLAQEYWGNEYGVERAHAFVELTFDTYDLDAFYTTCAADNDPSRCMIEKYVTAYGGTHEGLLRQHSARPNGVVTDQHRYSITRSEYEAATRDRDVLEFDIEW